MMMFARNKTTKNTCSSAPTTVYCPVGGKSKFKMLNSKYNLQSLSYGNIKDSVLKIVSKSVLIKMTET